LQDDPFGDLWAVHAAGIGEGDAWFLPDWRGGEAVYASAENVDKMQLGHERGGCRKGDERN
jgi:hypothetical protein